MGPENLTVGGSCQAGARLAYGLLCGVSNICVTEYHPEARNKRAFAERALYMVSTNGDMVLGNVGDGR